MARAFINRQPDYTDMDLDFLRNPTTGDVVRKTGEEAIKRSIRNLIFTNFYDRPFQSYIGSGIRALLFENATNFTADQIQSSITDVINNFEPRVSVVEVVVTPDYDRNGFNVQLTYVIKNREQPVITSIFLERVR
jgi:phage baseplate assembly protein W